MIKGKLLPKQISKWVHNGVHLMIELNDFKENSPWTIIPSFGFWMKFIFPSDSER